MMRKTMASMSLFGLMLGVSLAPSVLALGQTPAGSEQSALHAPVKHAPVCPGPAAAGTARCHAHVVVDNVGKPLATSGPAGYRPADLRSAYNVAGAGASSTVIAIVDAYGYPNAESDLAAYRAKFGLPACTTANGCFKKVNQSGVQGNYPRTDTGWSQETALDLDMASAMCPNCSLLLVEANSNSFLNLALAVNMAASMGAHAISNSYGGAESGTSTNYESYYGYPGIAVTVSSGDSGYGVEFPASSPHVIAVGGTSLLHSSTARGWSETAWSGAGSGCSNVYQKPSWQKDTGCSNRTVADVSAVADPNTGVAVYGPASRTRSAWMVFGGTSVGAPLVAGVYGVNGTAVTYGSELYFNTNALYDVTSGSNGSCGGSYLCTALQGYDGPTGLGTPDGVTAFGQ
jgi:subtilase family serine protease